MKTLTQCFVVLTALLFSHEAQAQVPALINYQGRVAVSGVNFNGTGQFKFALVGPGFNLAQPATATASAYPPNPPLNGAIYNVSINNPGFGYTTPPAVTFGDNNVGNPGSGATATANITPGPNGSPGYVSSITITNGGSGYIAPTVTIAPPPPNILYPIFWQNDNTFGPAAPAASVSLNVTNGLYSVLLGDTSLNPNPASPTTMFPIPAYVLGNADMRLRVWFDDGVHGSQLLSPDQRLAPAAYLADGSVSNAAIADGAIYGAKISAGTITGTQIASGSITGTQIASGSVTGTQIASGSITGAQLADGAVTGAKLVAPLDRATTGEEILRILRGSYSPFGANFGTGFTTNRNGIGDYTINFSTPFTSVPSVSVTPRTYPMVFLGIFLGYRRYTSNLLEVDANHVRILVITSATTSGTPPYDTAILEDRPFDFLVVGPR